MEATMSSDLAAVITAAAIVSVVVWFDRRCLADLAQTSDRDLRYFGRNTWALIIVLSFPIGPVLYLLYAKGPGRYS
jgi:undecaprenyl pyrophosphate phosphatase UppP